MVPYPTSHTQNEHDNYCINLFVYFYTNILMITHLVAKYVGLLWKRKIFVFPIDQAMLTVCFNWKYFGEPYLLNKPRNCSFLVHRPSICVVVSNMAAIQTKYWCFWSRPFVLILAGKTDLAEYILQPVAGSMLLHLYVPWPSSWSVMGTRFYTCSGNFYSCSGVRLQQHM